MYSYFKIVNTLDFSSDIIFNKKISEDSAQGSCGLLLINSDNQDQGKEEQEDISSCRELITDFKTNTVFYKYGNNGDNCTLSRQEYIIADSLLKTCAHLPNFMRPILYIKNHLIRTDICDDPFNLETVKDKKNISCVDIVLFEYIKNSITFWKTLKNKALSANFKNNILLQVFLALISAQQNVKFVHNDLHGNNILIIKCDKNLKILYRIKIGGEEKLFLVETHGYLPIIIDYGFSYTSECENMSLECADLDNFGLITYQFDSLSDFIRLFVVISSVEYNTELSEKINMMFKGLPINMEKSWETNIVKDHSMLEIEELFIRSFPKVAYKKNQSYYNQMLRLIMRSVLLPITYNKKYETVNPHKVLEKFKANWEDVSRWLKYDYEKIYVLREFIDSVRKYGYDFETINKVLRKNMLYITGKLLPFDYRVKDLVFSLKQTVGVFQNILYKNITNLNKKRENQLYSKLISGENMFLNILKYIHNDDRKNITSNDKVLFIDNIAAFNKLVQCDPGNYTAKELYDKYFKI